MITHDCLNIIIKNLTVILISLLYVKLHVLPIQARAQFDEVLVRDVRNVLLLERRISVFPKSIDISAEYGGDPRCMRLRGKGGKEEASPARADRAFFRWTL